MPSIREYAAPSITERMKWDLVWREEAPRNTPFASGFKLDDCASITLADGEIVRRNPDTIIVLTTNTDYKGCKEMNESILSRMCMVFDKKELTSEQMKKRVMVKTGCKDEFLPLL